MGSKSLLQAAAEALIWLIPMILSLTVHEFAHAFVAARLGDDTATKSGRLNLNPLSHIDPLGTVILPFVLLMLGNASSGLVLPFLAWARPVPVNAGKFRRTVSARAGSTLVAAVGPLSNLAMAFVCAGLLSFWVRHEPGGGAGLHNFFEYMIFINVGLFVVNLIPIHPLDGAKVVTGLLRPGPALHFERVNQQYGIFALCALFFLAGSIIAYPVFLVRAGLLAAVGLG